MNPVNHPPETHLFGRPRLLAAETRPESAPAAGQAFQPLPPPTGAYPFHLDLADVVGEDAVAAIVARGEIGFHMVGDTGGIVNPVPQENVAAALERDLTPAAGLDGFIPTFLYLLGDCIYFNGDPAQYYPQFYEPYTHYNLPIFAVPGNHDGDPATSANTSLDGFIANFCTPTPTSTKATGDSGRTTMTQPNVYWTLDTPYVTIIGLYTNVPEYGVLDDTQKAWLEHELATAPADRALIVTMHHPPYSADDFHSSSAYMQGVLDAAIVSAGRAPDLICAGHVHDYQRFTRTASPLPSAGPMTYLVAGNGGYHNLHAIAADVTGLPLPAAFPAHPGVSIDAHDDTHYGYTRMHINPTTITIDYVQVSPPPGVAPTAINPTVIDQVSIPIRKAG